DLRMGTGGEVARRLHIGPTKYTVTRVCRVTEVLVIGDGSRVLIGVQSHDDLFPVAFVVVKRTVIESVEQPIDDVAATDIAVIEGRGVWVRAPSRRHISRSQPITEIEVEA